MTTKPSVLSRRRVVSSKMSVEVAGGLALGLKSTTVKLPRYDEDQREQKRKLKNGFFLEQDEQSDTSSIGACSSEEEEEEDDGTEEVQSKESEENKSSLSSLDSLEDSLPVKNGLSSYYSGKSKSFTSLSNAANSNVKDLIKPENPFNKRRRVLMAWSRRASCGSLISMASSLPPLVPSQKIVEEDEEEEEIEEKRGNICKRKPSIFTPVWKNEESNKANKLPLKSPRSFSLTDLNKHALID